MLGLSCETVDFVLLEGSAGPEQSREEGEGEEKDRSDWQGLPAAHLQTA